jgi:hypothetical protein
VAAPLAFREFVMSNVESLGIPVLRALSRASATALSTSSRGCKPLPSRPRPGARRRRESDTEGFPRT